MFTEIRKSTPALTCALVIAVLLGIATSPVMGVPPHPDLQARQASDIAAGRQVSALPSSATMHALGIDTPDDFFLQPAAAKGSGHRSPVAGPFKILALLVDFSDNTSSSAASYFDSMLYHETGSSVRHYFDEISYSQIDLVTVDNPSSVGWTRAEETYSYYVAGQYGMYGAYPQNSQGLVEDLVDAVDPEVDFSEYDNNNDGFVDVVIVIHAGTGAEMTGSHDDIWSHKWAITPRNKDGVYIQSFTIQPEFWSAPGDMTIGVYCHELCHGFGLPDLYDTDNSSNGIGRWGIMSYGSWNGTMGNSPAHPCAWSRIQMGFADWTNVDSDISAQPIVAVEDGGNIFRLWTGGGTSTEYFLVENRQQSGYDAALPGSGLMVWHIDDAKAGNQQEWYPGQTSSQHYLVALEQADGTYDLEKSLSYGNEDDLFSASRGSDEFSPATTPNSDSYESGATSVVITNISSSADTMHADLIIGLAAGIETEDATPLPVSYELAQNYPNPFNPVTRIEFTLNTAADVNVSVYNVMGQKVATLLDGTAGPGTTSTVWDGTDASGGGVASGVYFYRLSVNNEPRQTRKMMLLK